MSFHPSIPLDAHFETCTRCDLNPCACSYVARLAPGADLAYLADVAAEQYTLPLPHRGGCPCPICHSRRLATWTRA